ncbi:MAG TPA: recombinase family protein [Clostridia bacterium]
MKVAMYLRKSRADEELEKESGEGSTLKRHKEALLKIAKERNLDIVNIFEEVVSGDELFFRPAMIQLLKELNEKKYDAVLVIDIQRLGRGDAEEQGYILKAFKNANIKIITPNKTYDLNNEFDEEYMEFEAFMGRKEYKMINRRMQGGRIRSVNEGNYLGARPPYGYLIERRGKGDIVLVPHPEQAPIVKMIFEMYIEGSGCGTIADKLNNLGIKSYTGSQWERTALSALLKNQVYIGKVTWKKKCIRKSKDPKKKKDAYTRNTDEWIVADGKHEPLVSEEVFQKAQIILAGKYHVPYHIVNGVQNPLAGIVVCKMCGSKMKRRPYYNGKSIFLICEKKCGSKSNKLDAVESAIIDALNDYYESITKAQMEHEKSNAVDTSLLKNLLTSTKKELSTLKKQKDSLHDFLEQGIYDTNTFLERSKVLNDKLAGLEKAIKETEEAINKAECTDLQQFTETLKNVIDVYNKTENVQKKNELLKTVLERVVYFKDKSCKDGEFEISIIPKLDDTSLM